MLLFSPPLSCSVPFYHLCCCCCCCSLPCPCHICLCPCHIFLCPCLSPSLSPLLLTSHSYYALPLRRESDLADCVIRHFLNESPLFLCEHYPADKPHRFFVGVSLLVCPSQLSIQTWTPMKSSNRSLNAARELSGACTPVRSKKQSRLPPSLG